MAERNRIQQVLDALASVAIITAAVVIVVVAIFVLRIITTPPPVTAGANAEPARVPVTDVSGLETAATDRSGRRRGARVVMLEFSDVQCPFCGRYARETLGQLKTEFVDQGRITVVGRFYRSSDGSRRQETGPGRDDVRVISIVNAAEGRIYTGSPRGGWTSRPAPDVIPGKYEPPRSLPRRPDIAEYPYRLAIKRGETGSLSAEEGFRAYQTNAPDGTMRLTVPELNLFDVILRLGNGQSHEYTNIELGEPPADLFHPPSGASVKALR